ncbi:propionyl-CoA synthetase [Blastomyces gilchristii SLH14081]|uniref:Propionyl-CoA synthetase n=1 Tax=Blastomyces gilchristii (strain SLH14081) TaxID=559298 RepID=A0A179V0Q9_BLAGS|nr:propionyl-CoA synthetase [Blastomyces gilchristii SLH14081]EQL35986.1 propionyl-CoA synthetase [Blastomyces dermatitidis ATCC 26199]EQL35987.1 propionyl-CoA synthetase, variant 1 [Blastomyces dermatitidis ATCC 26199]OAT12911.1 propionyl-CoA synthetase [Blastomyces gilchristii SLH14081]
MASHPQDRTQSLSLRSLKKFWSHHAAQLHWHKPPSASLRRGTKTLPASGISHEHWSWFPDGEISTTYNCVDRHVLSGHGDNVAIIYESPVTGVKGRYTYAQLLDEVEVLAGVLREEGVRRGDVVLIYMPMVPAALFAALAITRLGAVHAAVFGGFAATSLAQRIEASKPRAIMTASCGIEGSKGVVNYRPLVEGAIAKSSWKPQKVIVWQRDQLRWKPMLKLEGQRNWQRIVKSGRGRNIRAAPVPVKSNEALYIIYTSGTTGLPKGVIREAGGHAVGLNLSIKYLFDIKGPGDVMFCASDIGWVVGHSYILYAPLLAGATTVLYEGKPVGTPDAGSFWRIIEEHRVNAFFTAPTALRAIRKEDPEGRYFELVGKRGGLKHLRGLFLAGERSEPTLIRAYQNLLDKYAAPGAMVIDNWWSSESGSPMTGLALRSAIGLDQGSREETHKPFPVKAGSAGKPMPGFDVRIVDDEGDEVPNGTMGNIVLAMPLAPTAFTTLFNDDERFYKGYLKRFAGRWVDTGDTGMVDDEGYVHVMARSDDIINVAAHRFSTGAIEQAILSHPDIAEASVVGIPDPVKGHLPFAFVQLRKTSASSNSNSNSPIPATPPPALFTSVNNLVRGQIGAIASLGGMIQSGGEGKGMIPKTRSGKTLRRVLRELVENAVEKGDFERAVNVPATVEDVEVIEVARGRVREYFVEREKREMEKKERVGWAKL